MRINGKEYSLEDLLNEDDIIANMPQKVNEHLNLTGGQIEILTRHAIDYTTTNSLKELIYLIQEVLEVNEIEDLELVANELQERNYYENINK